MRDINIEKVNKFILGSKDDYTFISKFDLEDLLGIIVNFYDKYLCFHDKQNASILGSRLEMFLDVEFRIKTDRWKEDLGYEILDFSIEVCDLLRNISQEEFPNNKNIDEW